MDDALCVRGIQGVGNLNTQLHHLLEFQRLATDAMLERLAFHKLHGDKKTPCVFGGFVNRANVGMVERGSGTSLAAEAFEGSRVLRQIIGQKLERDVAAEAEVFGFVDHTHAAPAEFLQETVVGNGGP